MGGFVGISSYTGVAALALNSLLLQPLSILEAGQEPQAAPGKI